MPVGERRRKAQNGMVAIAIMITMGSAPVKAANAALDPVFDPAPLASNPPAALALSSGVNSIAVGTYSAVDGANSIAVGILSRAFGNNTSALGNLARANGDNSVAVGVLSAASGVNTTAIGNLSLAGGQNSTAIGILGTARGDNATAIGNQAVADGPNSAAIGTLASARGNDSTAFGTASAANSAYSVAIGAGSVADLPGTVSFGAPGRERRLTNIAPGSAETDAATYGQLVSLGTAITTRIDEAFAALNAPRIASAYSGVAVTLSAGQATGVHAVALGDDAIASASGAVAIGRNAAATAVDAVALGPNANATAPNAVALGGGSIAAQAGTVSVGAPGTERRITNVAGGTAPTDAVNLRQLQDGMATLGAAIQDVDRQARRGIAATAAMASPIMPSAPGRTTVSVSSGFYRGETGLSVGIARRLQLTMPVVIYGSYANGGGSEHVGRVGMALEF